MEAVLRIFVESGSRRKVLEGPLEELVILGLSQGYFEKTVEARPRCVPLFKFVEQVARASVSRSVSPRLACFWMGLGFGVVLRGACVRVSGPELLRLGALRPLHPLLPVVLLLLEQRATFLSGSESTW